MLLVMNSIAQVSVAPVTGPKLDNRRVLAGIVDLLIVAAGAAVILFAGDALTGDRGEVRGALGAVILGWALYYFFALESGDGQTVGKKLMKLRVMRADGSPAGMREIAVRTVLRVVDNYLVGLIVMLATGERRQRLGDLAAGTMVADASVPASAPIAASVEEAPAAEAETDFTQGEELAGAAGDAVEEPDASGGSATITLPARPSRPATLADLGQEGPAVPEMRPFPPVDEDFEPADDEPVAVYAPIMAEDAVTADEPVADEPFAGYEPIMAEDEPVVEDEPQAGVELEDDPAGDEPIVVKSVETVSAIDLIMGGAAEDEGSEESSQDPDAPAPY
jgi:uncharacterized RDD family membrane protein YckC